MEQSSLQSLPGFGFSRLRISQAAVWARRKQPRQPGTGYTIWKENCMFPAVTKSICNPAETGSAPASAIAGPVVLSRPRDTGQSGLRILQLCTDFQAGGIQRHVLDLSEWLRGRGHLVHFGGTPDVWLNEIEEAEFTPLALKQVSEAGGGLLQRGLGLGRAVQQLRALLHTTAFDLIHAHETAPAIVARLATLGASIPIAYTYHGSGPERVRQVGRVARLCADRVVTPSHRTARDLQQRGRVPARKLGVVGLGVKPAPQLDSGAVTDLRRRLLGDTGRSLVVTIARLEPQKSLDVLIDVARRVIAQRPDVRFVVAGSGTLEHQVRHWSRQAGVADKVSFIGRTDNVYAHLAAADLSLLTSRWEALPITIVEAFRCATPVVATDCGGVCELVDETVGALLPVGDAPGLASAVLDLCNDEQKRRMLARNALARSAEDRFSPDHVHQQFENLYTSMLSDCRGSRRTLPLGSG